MSPTFDGHATLDLGAVLPRLRIPTDLPAGLGVNIDVQETDADNLTELLNRDALIASQPDGEIARIRRSSARWPSTTRSPVPGSGLLVVVVVATAWAMPGPRRRRELFVALCISSNAVSSTGRSSSWSRC